MTTVLHGLQHVPVGRLAILVGETGTLECVERQGDPNFIDRTVRVNEEDVERVFMYRYVRTDLRCQGGYRVYVLNEINSGDIPIEEALRRIESINRSEAATLAHRVGDAGGARLRGAFHKRVPRLSDEAGNDEP